MSGTVKRFCALKMCVAVMAGPLYGISEQQVQGSNKKVDLGRDILQHIKLFVSIFFFPPMFYRAFHLHYLFYLSFYYFSSQKGLV